MPILNTRTAQLATIPGIKTCKVGLEANLTPDDDPIIRLTPSSLTPNGPGNGSRTMAMPMMVGFMLPSLNQPVSPYSQDQNPLD